MEQLRAEVFVDELPDGPRVRIEYEDGHVVWIAADRADSIVIRMHLGISPIPDEPV